MEKSEQTIDLILGGEILDQEDITEIIDTTVQIMVIMVIMAKIIIIDIIFEIMEITIHI